MTRYARSVLTNSAGYGVICGMKTASGLFLMYDQIVNISYEDSKILVEGPIMCGRVFIITFMCFMLEWWLGYLPLFCFLKTY